MDAPPAAICLCTVLRCLARFQMMAPMAGLVEAGGLGEGGVEGAGEGEEGGEGEGGQVGARVGGEEGVGMEAGEVEGVGGEVKGGQLAGEGVPLMVAP